MKKSKANQIIKKWNECFAGNTEETKTVAELCEYDDKTYAIKIKPCGRNRGTAFYHTKELALIENFYSVGCWVGRCKCEGYDDKVVYAHIY